MKHILLTGKPRVGKTTLIERVVEFLSQNYPQLVITGFVTKEVLSAGTRIGFDIITLEGKRGLLARIAYPHLPRDHRIGKYHVELNDLVNIGLPSILKHADLIIIDEIGKMELLSSEFRQTIYTLLNNDVPILGTITIANIPSTKKIKESPNVLVFHVTPQNRDEIYSTVINIFQDYFSQ